MHRGCQLGDMVPGFFKYWKRSKAEYIGDINIRDSIRRSGFLLGIIIALHTVLMVLFESLPLGDSLWLTLTTITTVGYGDISAATFEGRLSTILLLYFGGVFVLANFAGEYFEARVARKKRMLDGNWEWQMSNHMVIINTPESGGTSYFYRLFSQIRKIPDLKDIPIQILTRQYPDGLPEELRNLGVVHHTRYPDKKQSLEAVNIGDAKYIVVLAKQEYNFTSDALTFDILHRIREIDNLNATIIAECVDDENRSRLLNAGADIILRPVRSYPELVVRAIVAPGSEKILENLFMHDGDHPERYDLDISDLNWGQIVSSLMLAGHGTALAYIDDSGEPVCNPEPQKQVKAKALLIMVRENNQATLEQLSATLAQTKASTESQAIS